MSAVKKKKVIYEAPKAVSLSGVAQGACTPTGSLYIPGGCASGVNAGGPTCETGSIVGHGACKAGGTK